jgi:hypothetical protein
MLQLFRWAPAKPAARRGRAFLRLEEYEGRATPSGDGLPTKPQDSPPAQDVRTGGCQIVDLAAEEISNGVFIISGRVIDANPGGLVVHFGGDVTTLNGTSITTDADGNFSEVVMLQTNGTDAGWLLAQTTDRDGNVSNEAATYVMPTP